MASDCLHGNTNMIPPNQPPVCSYTETDFLQTVPRWPAGAQTNKHNSHAFTPFDTQLQATWNEAKRRGAFRYNLDTLHTKILPGKFGFVAQLNLKRAIQRRKPQKMDSINQPFDPNQFNFTKINPNEVLFEVKSPNDAPEVKNLMIINVSPLEYCNSLLIPSINSLKPQSLDASGLKLAVETILLSSTNSLRIGFNSLRAYASVNHYHFHIFYLNVPLFIETVNVVYIANDCYEVTDYAVPGFAFQLENMDVDRLVVGVMRVVEGLKGLGVPYNVFVTRGAAFGESRAVDYGTVRVFVWPREVEGEDKDVGGFNVACCEISGHLPVKEEAAFDGLCEGEVVEVLRKACEKCFYWVRGKLFGF